MFEPAWDDEHKAMRCPVCSGTLHDEPEDFHRPDCPIRQRDALRALVTPFLDDPIRYSDDERGVAECLFCDGYDSLRGRHSPCCPVLLRDELLGRLTESTV